MYEKRMTGKIKMESREKGTGKTGGIILINRINRQGGLRAKCAKGATGMEKDNGIEIEHL